MRKILVVTAASLLLVWAVVGQSPKISQLYDSYERGATKTALPQINSKSKSHRVDIDSHRADSDK